MDFFAQNLPVTLLSLKQTCLMRGNPGRGAHMAAMHPGWRVRWLLMDYSLTYGHHGLRSCSTHLQKILCQWCGLHVPVTHVRPPDTLHM